MINLKIYDLNEDLFLDNQELGIKRHPTYSIYFTISMNNLSIGMDSADRTLYCDLNQFELLLSEFNNVKVMLREHAFESDGAKDLLAMLHKKRIKVVKIVQSEIDV